MTKKQIAGAWEKLDFELTENRPKIDGPYPPDVVRRRELLLLAQAHLNKISSAKTNKNSQMEEFHAELYKTIMDNYYGGKENTTRN